MPTARLLDRHHLPNTPEAREQERRLPVEDCCTECGSQDLTPHWVEGYEQGYRCEALDVRYLRCECGEEWEG